MRESWGGTNLDAFGDELRSWLGDHLTEEVVLAGSRPVEGANLEVLARVEPDPCRGRVGGAIVAGRTRRARCRRR